MGLREQINDNPAITTAATGAIIGLALLFIIFNLMCSGSSGGTAISSQAFYTVDDGATFFVDDANKIVPFDHEGKPAYQAFVFEPDGGGEQFVGYIRGMPTQLAEQLRELRAQADAGAAVDEMYMLEEQAQYQSRVKKPGGPWVLEMSEEGFKVVSVTAPDGGPAKMVRP